MSKKIRAMGLAAAVKEEVVTAAVEEEEEAAGGEVAVRMAAWPMTPPRLASERATRWSWLPVTPSMP